MRWPFRRRDTARTPTPPPTTAAGPVAAASRPRADWARLPPIRRSVDPAPPVTFHGERFGRSVAGARRVATPSSVRDRRSRHAPSGIMLDATWVETIEPAPARVDHPLPAVVVAGPRPRAVHRRPAAGRAPDRDLLTAGVHGPSPFDPPPPRPPVVRTAMSWSADDGFAGGIGPVAPPAPRFVPATAPRHERVPRSTATLVQDLTGVDVADTVIDRSPATSARAAELGAIAFTEAGTVHLPAELGELDAPVARSVLAHELAHVAQHRRRRATTPDEGSTDGRHLEAEAQAVQQAARRGVRPLVMRRHEHLPVRGGAPGVQRLADDPYAWQDRDDQDSDDVSPTEAREMTGLFRGYSVRADSAWGRRRARDEQEWADGFEGRHARRLVTRRNERYAELLEQAAAERRERADDPTGPIRLGRRDVLAVRSQVDEEMPFEHGVPEGYPAFPDQLPEPAPDDDREEPDAAEPEPDTAGAPRTGRTAPPARRARAVLPIHTPAAQRTRRGATGGAGAASRSTPPSEGARFDWQDREPTEAETVAAMFGGGLFGDVLGASVGPDTDDDRARAERERLPELLRSRQRRERELRHRRLRDHLRDRSTVAAREETPEADRSREPIRLTPAEITEIREQIDQELPLEFAVPEYLPAEEDAEISHTGDVSPVTGASEPAADRGAGTAPDGAGAETSAASAADARGAAETPRPEPVPSSVVAAAADRPSSGAEGHGGGVTLGTAAAIGSALDAARGPGDDAGSGAADDDVPVHDRRETAASTLLASASEHDIDALSRRVWSRIRREMRTELLVDRERAGVLADMC